MKTIKFIYIMFFLSLLPISRVYCGTPQYMTVTLNGIEPANGYCADGPCDINTPAQNPWINKKYILKLAYRDEDCYSWEYIQDSGFVSERRMYDYSTWDKANGLTITFSGNRLTNVFSLSVTSTIEDIAYCDYCQYYSGLWVSTQWPDGYIDIMNVPNMQQACSCTPWAGIPPWNGGTGGRADVRSSVDFTTFSILTAQQEVSLQDLYEFCEEWNSN